MTIAEVSPDIFHNRLPEPAHLYGSVAFSELNRHKCTDSDLRYLLFSDSKVRAGLILGRHEHTLHTPFSAPFGGLVVNRPQRVETIRLIWRTALQYARQQNLGLRVTLPPEFYDPDTTAKSILALHELGMSCVLDLNYHVLTRAFCEENCASRFRNQLHQARNAHAEVTLIDSSPESIERVYSIVQQNHFAKHRPVHIPLDNLIATVPVAQARFFVVTHSGCDIAGAMVYTTAPGIAQAIYWGDIPGYGHLRPMNLLADYIIRYYAAQGVGIVDFGPSTEHGTPNTGLCAFKESFTAIPAIKPTFSSRV